MTAIPVPTPSGHPIHHRFVATQLAELAHELRTPLNSVIGLSGILARGIPGPLTDQQSAYIAQIEAGGRHVLALVNTILDLSRADAGKLQLDLTEVAAPDVIESAVAMVRESALAKGIFITTGHDPGLPVIQADRLRLKQVVLNLLTNAVAFSDSGERVGVYARRNGASVAIDVWDTGIGIADDDVERVFEPFEQVDHTLSRTHRGTGLGLPVSRRLTELQGGQLSVRSALGYGSVFTAAFPVAVQGSLPTIHSVAPERPAAPAIRVPMEALRAS